MPTAPPVLRVRGSTTMTCHVIRAHRVERRFRGCECLLALPPPLTDSTLAAHAPLRDDLTRWMATARRAGLDNETIEALFHAVQRAHYEDKDA